VLKVFPDYQAPAISTGDRTNPMIIVCDRLSLKPVVQRYYLHNDDPMVYYTNINLQAQEEQLQPGWNLQVLVQDTIPIQAQWDALETNNLAAAADIGSAMIGDVGFHPFWVRLTVPDGTPIQTLAAPALRLFYTQAPVNLL
jgi:hypothetical protein